jgi:uncharacterized protein YjeT (DUF2065 family)
MNSSLQGKREGGEHPVWDKIIMRLLTIVYIVEGAAALLAPESMGKLTHWFADNPRYMRLGGTVAIGLGVWLALRQYQQEALPRPWYRRWFKS